MTLGVRCPGHAQIGRSPGVAYFSQDQAASTFCCHQPAWQVPGSAVTLAATSSDSPTAPKPSSASTSHRCRLCPALPERPDAPGLLAPGKGRRQKRWSTCQDAGAAPTPAAPEHPEQGSVLALPTRAASSPLRQGSAVHPARSEMLQTWNGCHVSPRCSRGESHPEESCFPGTEKKDQHATADHAHKMVLEK